MSPCDVLMGPSDVLMGRSEVLMGPCDIVKGTADILICTYDVMSDMQFPSGECYCINSLGITVFMLGSSMF